MKKRKQSPNVVFLVLDTHRVDRLGCFGYDRGTSPNIDAFAKNATVFENAISPGQWTVPSHASMFTGESPSTHTIVQSGSALDPRFKTLAERLREVGYKTVGLCNNPLVGVLNNGFKRGFDTFYNYGGAIPSIPRKAKGIFAPFIKLWEYYTFLLRKISYPVQNWVAQNEKIFSLTLIPFLVPIWSKYAHFKGDTRRSTRDAAQYFQENVKEDKSPHFMFINLMETHLPYSAPEKYIKKYAPLIKENPEAREFLRFYNTQAINWFIPMKEKFTDLQYETLSQIYDAEVAYQDHLLENLLKTLDEPYHRENTMVVIVADHGEMLGEHMIMGHGLGVYQELIHVPLIIRYPGQQEGSRVSEPVSTTHLFHTVLDAVGFESVNTSYAPETDVRQLSLLQLAKGKKSATGYVVSEAYPPEHVIKTIKKFDPTLIKKFFSDIEHWAVYEKEFKLHRIHGMMNKLFNLKEDPLEFTETDDAPRVEKMNAALEDFVSRAEARRPEDLSGESVLMDDEKLLQRLRGLGYLE